MSLYLCVISCVLCYWAGRRSLVNGLITLIAIGYLYGIVRANVPETFSHFIFDTGVIGLYLAQLFRRLSPVEEFRVAPLRMWLEFLIVWPLLLFLVPIQDWLIQFVGLRGSIFLLPFIFLGARLDGADRHRLALWIAGFNVAAFLLAGTEYFLGLEWFFPHNHVTELIYLSKDLVGHTQYRIPGPFANAHAYGGTMVMGLPLLLGALVQRQKTNLQFQMLVLGVGTALLGVLMSAARTHFMVAGILIIVATFSLRSRLGYVLGWLILLGGIGLFVSGEQRLQRFIELKDPAVIAERISWSVNMNLVEIATEYPFGNGLGGGGTSIPYFLQGRIINPVAMENEYARIMLEQGLTGLFIWTLFILWIFTRRNRDPGDPWYLGRRLAFVASTVYFVTGLTGTGLLTSIPQTSLFLLLVGWVGAEQVRTEAVDAAPEYGRVDAQAQHA